MSWEVEYMLLCDGVKGCPEDTAFGGGGNIGLTKIMVLADAIKEGWHQVRENGKDTRHLCPVCWKEENPDDH